MSFDFGKNLKELRLRKNLTQEQAAELLGLTKQSVSRWENNATYPDILFLPTIAAFYGVTTDYLLGVSPQDADAYRDKCLDERQALHHSGDLAGAHGVSQQLYLRFPNDLHAINAYMVDSYLMGVHSESGERGQYLQQSVTVAQRFMKLTDDLEEKCRCIRNIAICFKRLGSDRLAVDWLMKLPSAWSGIETAALDVFEGEELAASVQDSLDTALHLLYRLICAAAAGAGSPKTKRAIYAKLPALCKALFENEDYGFYHLYLSRVYLEMAKCGANDAEIAEALRGALFHAKQYDEAVEGAHTSVLFRGKEIAPGEWTKADAGTQYAQIEKLAAENGLIQR